MSEQFPKKPKGIEIKHLNDQIIIIIREQSNNCSIITLTVSTLIFIAITLILNIWSFREILQSLDKETNILYSLASSLGSIAGGIYLIYLSIRMLHYTIDAWIGRTCIIASNEAIITYDKPIPYPNYNLRNNTELRVANLERLYSKRIYEHRSRYYPKDYFEVRARTNNDESRKLIAVTNSSKALYIKETLQDYLNIKNEPQEGELGNEI